MRVELAFLPVLAATFMLVFARIGTMVMLLPGLGEMSMPVRVRLTVALVLSAMFLPLHRNAYNLDLREFGPVLLMLGHDRPVAENRDRDRGAAPGGGPDPRTSFQETTGFNDPAGRVQHDERYQRVAIPGKYEEYQ